MKDERTNGKKMASKGRTKVIYKGTFVSKQSLETLTSVVHQGFFETVYLSVLSISNRYCKKIESIEVCKLV